MKKTVKEIFILTLKEGAAWFYSTITSLFGGGVVVFLFWKEFGYDLYKSFWIGLVFCLIFLSYCVLIFFIKNLVKAYSKLEDLQNGISFLERLNVSVNTLAYKIVVIDNEDQQNIIKPLKNRGYKISYLNDVTDIEQLKSYDIIICDINDVGKHFGSEYEGGYILKEVSHKYPLKYRIFYTGAIGNPKFNSYIKLSDVDINKGETIDKWQTKLNNAAGILGNPYKLILRTVNRLNEIQGIDVKLIEEVKKIVIKNFQEDKNISIKTEIESKFSFNNSSISNILEDSDKYIQIIKRNL